jgi:hypothetical protein
MYQPTNPFTAPLVVKYIKNVTDIIPIKGKNSKILYGFETEAEDYTRMYTAKKYRDVILKMTIYARDMFLTIQYFTNDSYEYVILSLDKIKELRHPEKVSKRKYEDTIRELIRHDVISIRNKKDNSFWYNPRFYCAGNRLTMFEDRKLKLKTVYVTQKELND